MDDELKPYWAYPEVVFEEQPYVEQGNGRHTPLSKLFSVLRWLLVSVASLVVAVLAVFLVVVVLFITGVLHAEDKDGTPPTKNQTIKSEPVSKDKPKVSNDRFGPRASLTP